MDSIKDLQETEIWNYLHSINSNYAKLSIVFVEKITPILNTISKYFPFYTEHNSVHSNNILKRMYQILNRECFDSSNQYSLSHIEIYLLICSSYAHDIG